MTFVARLAAVLLPLSLIWGGANAATVHLDETDSDTVVGLLDAGSYLIDFSVDGPSTGQQDFSFGFDIPGASAPIGAVAAAVNFIIRGDITGLEMNWGSANLDNSGGAYAGGILNDATFTFTPLGDQTIATAIIYTSFTGANLTQWLNIGWQNFEGGSDSSVALNIDVNAVPVPLAAPLFITGLVGLGVIRRRRKLSTQQVTAA